MVKSLTVRGEVCNKNLGLLEILFTLAGILHFSFAIRAPEAQILFAH